jgi:dienelactone hydrolase
MWFPLFPRELPHGPGKRLLRRITYGATFIMRQAILMRPSADRQPPVFNVESGPILRRDVEFDSGGVTCRAWLYTPDARSGRPAPCIVMAHGLGGTRECALEPYARRFAQAGFFVLLFDYRRLGASDGEPPQVIRIADEIEDWAAAIACARTIPDVDPHRIGLWGTSLSGGHVLVAAAKDQGVAAISAQCPMMDGAASAKLFRRAAGPVLMARVAFAGLKDCVRALLGKTPYYVPLAAPPGEVAAMSTPDAYAGIKAIMPDHCRTDVAARLLFSLPLYRPLRHAKDVHCPALIIACANDSVASPQAAASTAARMGGPVRHLELPIGHFDIYLGQWFVVSCAAQVAFFQEALLGRADPSI